MLITCTGRIKYKIEKRFRSLVEQWYFDLFNNKLFYNVYNDEQRNFVRILIYK